MSVNDGGAEGRQTANESGGGGLGTGARIAIGGTVLAAALGVGAFVITDQLTKKPAEQTEVAAMAPAGSVPAASEKSLAASAAPASTTPSASESPISKEVREKIEKARGDMAKHGVKVDRPVPEAAGRVPKDKIQMTQVGSLSEGGIVRMVTAKGDLTGQRELSWVAGGVFKHRGVDCTQTFKFSSNNAPGKRPNLLVCYRTSATKSVVAVVVDPKGHPSPDKAVTELEKKWKSMG